MNIKVGDKFIRTSYHFKPIFYDDLITIENVNSNTNTYRISYMQGKGIFFGIFTKEHILDNYIPYITFTADQDSKPYTHVPDQNSFTYGWSNGTGPTLTPITKENTEESCKQVNTDKKCECGADKCKAPFHSDWCPKYNKGE